MDVEAARYQRYYTICVMCKVTARKLALPVTMVVCSHDDRFVYDQAALGQS